MLQKPDVVTLLSLSPPDARTMTGWRSPTTSDARLDVATPKLLIEGANETACVSIVSPPVPGVMPNENVAVGGWPVIGIEANDVPTRSLQSGMPSSPRSMSRARSLRSSAAMLVDVGMFATSSVNVSPTTGRCANAADSVSGSATNSSSIGTSTLKSTAP